MNPLVSGVGWVSNGRCGTERGGVELAFDDVFALRDALLERGMLPGATRRFAKYDDTCRMASLVAALTLRDGGVSSSTDVGRKLAVVGTSEDGCLETNRAFYRDFLEHGRKRGRGSLFVYTLPSMPFAEVSMQFNLTGPSVWTGATDPGLRPLLDRAACLLEQGGLEGVLALHAGPADGLGLLLVDDSASRPGLRLDELSSRLEENGSIRELVERRWSTASRSLDDEPPLASKKSGG